MDNADIQRVFDEVADLLEILGGSPFRARAYRNAARTVEAETTSFARLLAEGRDLTELPAIGKDMASHIAELVGRGRLAAHEELLAKVPRSLVELMRLPGVGPKRARKLWEDLEIETVDQLERAAKAGKVAELPGFGEKSQAKILAGIADYREQRSRFRIDEADRLAEPLLVHLGKVRGVARLEVAGSFRRRRETVGDLDLLAIAGKPGPVMKAFTAYPGVERVVASGDTRGAVVLASGLQVDLRIVPRESYGAAMVYFTGSKDHNVRLRTRAVERGLKINEYGVFQVGKGRGKAKGEGEGKGKGEGKADEDPRGGKRVAGREEKDVYASVGLPWIPPELREDRGELAAAEAGKLPRLLRLEDLRGDLQMHSTWSDGRNSIEEMLAACAERGYEYFALTDHGKALAMIRGLDAKRLRQQWKEIDAIQERHPEIRLLKSMEVDILADGSLDLDDDMLARLDLVLVSVHSRFDLPAAQQTRRILKAVRHPQADVLAHPTGRLIGERKPLEFDLDEVLHACAEHGVAVELNAHPERLDLKDTHLMLAKKLGVKVVVSTDAHSTKELGLIRYGVEQARRAWLGPQDVLNTRPLKKLLAAFAK